MRVTVLGKELEVLGWDNVTMLLQFFPIACFISHPNGTLVIIRISCSRVVDDDEKGRELDEENRYIKLALLITLRPELSVPHYVFFYTKNTCFYQLMK